MQRKCPHCGEKVEFDADNMQGVAYLKARYYHTNCLLELAKDKRQKKKHAAYWDTMESDISTYENDAKKQVIVAAGRDKLNEHILSHYNITNIPSRFWNVISDIGNGNYNKRKCKPVDANMLFETWQWGQKNLDKITKNNKKIKKGPKNDSERINYDLAIVLNHVTDYERYIEKIKIEEAEREMAAKEKIKIDYSKIVNNANRNNDGLDDISDLLDELF